MIEVLDMLADLTLHIFICVRKYKKILRSFAIMYAVAVASNKMSIATVSTDKIEPYIECNYATLNKTYQ